AARSWSVEYGTRPASSAVRRARLRGLTSTAAPPGRDTTGRSSRPSALAWTTPSCVSGTSGWLVCRPLALHSVVPCRTSTRCCSGARDIARPLGRGFADEPSVEVLQAEVETVKLSDRSLTLADGTVLGADHLVLAAGARPAFFGVPGAAEHAFPMYSVADAERLRLHVQALVDEPGSGEETLDVVVVGGGPTGVETTGALAELMTALSKTGRIAEPGRITLVDHG